MTATLDAKAVDAKTQGFDVEDIEYLRDGDKPLLARVFKPRGEGPFPALVECHGGGWCAQDRLTEKLRHQAMASHGIVSIALDFRSGNEAPYPASVADINYAVRWTRLNARMLKTRPDLVGLLGPVERGPSRPCASPCARTTALHRDPVCRRARRRRTPACAAS